MSGCSSRSCCSTGSSGRCHSGAGAPLIGWVDVKIRKSFIIAGTIALGATLFGAAPANAAETAAPKPVPQACLTDLGDGSQAPVTSCYPVGTNLDAKIEAKTGAAPIHASSAKQARTLQAASPQATIVLAIFYNNANYSTSGGYQQVTGTSPCSTYSYAGYPKYNDAISSFHSYSGCKSKLYENSDSSGATYGYYVDSANVGAAMNDRASRYSISG